MGRGSRAVPRGTQTSTWLTSKPLFLLADIILSTAVFLPLCVRCGHEISADADFCESCGAPTSRPQERDGPEASHLVNFVNLPKTLKVALLLALIIGISLLAASLAFQPRSTTPEYTANLRSQLDQLNSQLAKLQSNASNLQTQIRSLKDQISSSQSKLTKAQAEIQELQSQLYSVAANIVSLKQQLDDIRSQLVSARATLVAAEQELNQIRNSLEEASAKVQQLEMTLQQQQATLQDYVVNRDQAQRKHDSLLSEWNTRVTTYNNRVETYNQKKQEYDARWAGLQKRILALIAIVVVCGVIGNIEGILTCLGLAGIDVSDMWAEHDALQQLKNWLDGESNWLKSEEQRLGTLKAELDEAKSDLAKWNERVHNQQALVANTQNDLDQWTSRKSQLASQLADAQNRVDQLTAQVRNLEFQELQLQASLDSDLEKEQQLKSSIEHDQAEVTSLADSIASNTSQKLALESTLQKCQADMQKVRKQVDALSYELYLVTAHPYLRWGGLGILTLAVGALAVTAVGVTTIAFILRVGLGRVRGLTSRIRRPSLGPELEAPAKPVEEAPAEMPARVEPEVQVIPIEPTEQKMVKPRKRRPSPAKPRKGKPASKRRKARMRKEPSGMEQP